MMSTGRVAGLPSEGESCQDAESALFLLDAVGMVGTCRIVELVMATPHLMMTALRALVHRLSGCHSMSCQCVCCVDNIGVANKQQLIYEHSPAISCSSHMKPWLVPPLTIHATPAES
jgi:hypothetical protein